MATGERTDGRRCCCLKSRLRMGCVNRWKWSFLYGECVLGRCQTTLHLWRWERIVLVERWYRGQATRRGQGTPGIQIDYEKRSVNEHLYFVQRTGLVWPDVSPSLRHHCHLTKPPGHRRVVVPTPRNLPVVLVHQRSILSASY